MRPAWPGIPELEDARAPNGERLCCTCTRPRQCNHPRSLQSCSTACPGPASSITFKISFAWKTVFEMYIPTAGCIFGGRPTPRTDARALSTQAIQENQKIQLLPRYSYGGFETAHVDTSKPSRCTYVFRIVVSSHMAELRKPGHPPMLGAFDRVLGHSCPLSIPQKNLNTF